MTATRALPEYLRAVVMAGALVVHLFVLTPITLYSGNAGEFSTPLPGLLQLCLLPALAVFLLLAVPARLLPGDANRYMALLATLGILVWLQTNVLVWDYGVLDGRTIDWQANYWQGIVDGAIWVLALIAAAVAHRRLGKWLCNAALLVLFTNSAATAYTLTTASSAASDATAARGSLEQAIEFSAGRNVVHILLDGFQSDIFEDLINHPEFGESLRRELTGFVYYRETLGVFPYTQLSIPAYTGGRVYRNDSDKDTFINGVLAGHNIMNTAVEQGYELDLLVSSTFLTQRFARTRHDNLVNVSTIHTAEAQTETAKLVDLSLFRATPHFVKPLVYNDQRWMLTGFMSPNALFSLDYFNNAWLMQWLASNSAAARAAPVYKYVHLFMAHRPMVVDERCRYAGRVLPDERVNRLNQSWCTLVFILAVLQRMKTLGIYDEALIVIHADHGGRTPDRRVERPIVLADGTQAHYLVNSLASPLLLMKRPRAGGELQVSRALVSLLDIPDTISSAMQWPARFGHRSLLEVSPDERRIRRYHFYDWRGLDDWRNAYTAPIQEFVIEGSHFDTEWRIGRVFLPPGESPPASQATQ